MEKKWPEIGGLPASEREISVLKKSALDGGVSPDPAMPEYTDLARLGMYGLVQGNGFPGNLHYVITERGREMLALIDEKK